MIPHDYRPPSWDKPQVVKDHLERHVGGQVDTLHPADQPKVLRDLAEHCTKEATRIDAENTEKGVPKR